LEPAKVVALLSLRADCGGSTPPAGLMIKNKTMKNLLANSIKKIGITLFGALSAAIQVILPLVILVLAFVIIDCITAWRLSRRVHKRKCHNGKKGSCGKFKSDKMGKSVLVMILFIPAGLLLAYFVQFYIFSGTDIRLPQIFSGIVIFWQLWSILENESSCSDARWAKVLQKIMIDKTERHFDVDLSELKDKENENQ
jgi:hypothetical protein